MISQGFHAEDSASVGPETAFASFRFAGRSHDAAIRLYDNAGKVIETPEHAGAFKEW
jgi:hypothetical protein